VVDNDKVVTAVTEEKKRRIMTEDRANIEPRDAEEAFRDARGPELEPIEDPLEKWRREQLELEAKRDRERTLTARQLNEQRSRDWEAWLHGHLERDWESRSDIIAQVVAHERKAHRAQFAKLEARITQLETKQRGVDDGGVVDMPSPLMRKIRIQER
jgi:hypothetical protein